MELLHGCPPDLAQRSARQQKAFRFLDALGVSYDRTDHPDHPGATMEACAKIDETLNVRLCKNLFLCNRQKTVFYLLLLPGDKPFKTKELSGQLQVSRLSFANGEDLRRVLRVEPGSVSVLALLNDEERAVRLLIDADVLKEPYFACHPCENTASLRFPTEDLLGKVLPALGSPVSVVRLSGKET